MQTYFFDLDGTLTDSRLGLHTSFRSALQALGTPPLNDAELDRFLGTPLPEMFRVLKPDVSKAEIERGIEKFRLAYEETGILENRLYPGVDEMLDAILQRGGRIWVVTSKPEHYAIRVTQDLKLDRCIQGVIGAGLDEKDTKAELISRALVAARAAASEAVMLGDRFYDIEGALQNKVFPVGALWGYGSYEELHSAGCENFARSPDEFRTRFVEGTESELARKPSVSTIS